MAEPGSGGTLERLLAEERVERRSAAQASRNGYMPETYTDQLRDFFARHGGLGASALTRAEDAFAAARRGRRHMVFRPDPAPEAGTTGAMMAVGTGLRDDGTQGVDLYWQVPDGRVLRRQVALPPDAPEGLVGNERALRASTDTVTHADLRGAALSPYSRAVARRAVDTGQEIYADVRLGTVGPGAPVDPGDRQTIEKSQRQFVKLQSLFERKRYAGSLVRFTRHLDPEAMKILHQTGLSGLNRYNWLVGDGDPARRRNRIQAAQAFPLVFAHMSSGKETGLERAIDGGAPLLPALAESLKTDPTTLKRLQGVHWQRAGRFASKNPGKTLENLAMIPPNWTPVGRKDWAAFHAAMGSIHQHAANLHRRPETLVRSTGGDWRKSAHDLPRIQTEGARDMLRDIQEKVLLPAIAQKLKGAGCEDIDDAYGPASRILSGIKEHEISHAVFGDKSAKKIATAVQRWHRSRARIEAAGLDEKSAEICWEPLSEPFTTASGWTVTPLTDAVQLGEEGRAMDHCVGGYAEACVNERAHIVSIRDAAGHRVSTAEIREVETTQLGEDDPMVAQALARAQAGDRTLLVLQNHGVANDERGADRPVERAAAIQDYLSALSRNGPDYDRLDRGRAEARGAMDAIGGLRARVGYDPFSQDIQQGIYEIQRESMIGPARTARTPEAFLEATGGLAMVERNVAEFAERERAERAAAAACADNDRRIADISRRTSRDPAAEPAPAMSYAEYFALAPERRPDPMVEVRPNEGNFRGLAIPRGGDGKPEMGARSAGACVAAHLIDRVEGSGGMFLRARLSNAADQTFVGFTREEAAAAREVALGVRELQRQRREGLEQRPLREVLQSQAVQRFAHELASGPERQGRQGHQAAV